MNWELQPSHTFTVRLHYSGHSVFVFVLHQSVSIGVEMDS